MAAVTAERTTLLEQFAARPVLEPPDVGALRDAALEPNARQAAILVWQRRVINEHGSVDVATRLIEASASFASPALHGALARLQEDELRHEQLARTVLQALGGSAPQATPSPQKPSGTNVERFARLVLAGLVVGEGVSAARYATVREHTDVPVARAAIDVLLRDEVQHAELGLALVPLARSVLLENHVSTVWRDFAHDELRASFRWLDSNIGMDAQRRGIALQERAQPAGNVGVVEPLLDACALYRVIEQRIAPRLDACDTDATQAWTHRWRP